jgi:hypothetical protein
MYSTFLHHFLMILNFLMILKFLIVHRLNIRIVCARSQFNLCGISVWTDEEELNTDD